ncbi:hypothetical protein CJ18C100_CJ18C100_00509 [Campylobacter jejuni]|nr:hypothetical protein CJ18C100_CJ18C100_00509 [Campylobacter jejuni]CAH1409751.1 hypothetical protein H660L_01758 [Campylobacter jejuni]
MIKAPLPILPSILIPLPSLELSKSCPLASIEASTPVVSLTELIAATKAPLASPSLYSTLPIFTPLIVKSSEVVPALTAAIPLVSTVKVALTPVLSAFLLISSAKAPSPVPTEVEITTF